MERRLAVIVAADVVGYSALMERDEAGTFERLKAGRKELFEPEIERHHGRIFKLMGDGLLAEFSSVVDALECAVALQRGLAERNASFPEADRIQIRIGVNLGEVIVEGEDRFGEGVNVAARLEQLARPGDIYVSGKVAKEVGKKLAFDFEPMGEQKVKNLAEPVAVYRVRLEGDGSSRFRGLAKRRAGERQGWARRWEPFAVVAVLLMAVLMAVVNTGLWFRPWEPKFEPELPLPEKPSIAIMPFTNMSGDPQQDYFADGMTDSLITDLSRVSGLFVIARNSTFSYKGRTIDPRQAARELGVRYVLEGSIQRAGNSVRINAQLIDATTDGHAWADRYDGSMADVFALQDKVTQSIASALAVSLTSPEQRLLSQQETKVPAAYDAFLRGWEHYRRTTPEDFAKSIPCFEEAIRLDPDYARAYAALAMVYILAYDWGWSGSLGLSSSEAFSKVQHYLAEGQKRPTSTSFQAAAAYWVKFGEGDIVLDFYKKAIALDPSDSWSYAYLALAQTGIRRQSEAMANIKTAMRLDPHYPPVFLLILGLVQLSSGDYEQASRSLNQATKLNPDNEYTLLVLAATYGYLDRKQEAESVIARYNDLRAKRGDTPLTMNAIPKFFSGQYTTDNVLRKGLRLASVPERLQGSEFAVKNRLRADEIRNLLFGHRLRGRTITNGNEHAAEITPQGFANVTGDWGTITAASTSFKGDEVCFAEAGGGSFCVSILRNPNGSRLVENEYIWLDKTGVFPFSQIE
jgi:adenylate cyclase